MAGLPTVAGRFPCPGGCAGGKRLLFRIVRVDGDRFDIVHVGLDFPDLPGGDLVGVGAEEEVQGGIGHFGNGQDDFRAAYRIADLLAVHFFQQHVKGLAFFGVFGDGGVFELHGIGQKVGAEVARLDAGDPDAEVGEFVAQRFGQAGDGEFGGAIDAAAGKAGLVTGDMIKPGAVVIDVGINRVDGKTVGDVVFDEVAAQAGAVTPVPGGVGAVTTMMVLENVVCGIARTETIL